MAKKLYNGVNNVCRRGKKLYIGVNNIARRGKKAYIGDANGVARLFFQDAVEWKKYAFTITEEEYEEEYTYYSKKSETGSQYATDGVSGYAAYRFDSKTGTFTMSGGKESYSGSEAGQVYNGGGSSVTQSKYNGKGYATDVEIYAVEETGYRTETRTVYSVGGMIGIVDADEGAYPDADAGYSYYMTYEGYIVMNKGDTYYAYKKA